MGFLLSSAPQIHYTDPDPFLLVAPLDRHLFCMGQPGRGGVGGLGSWSSHPGRILPAPFIASLRGYFIVPESLCWSFPVWDLGFSLLPFMWLGDIKSMGQPQIYVTMVPRGLSRMRGEAPRVADQQPDSVGFRSGKHCGGEETLWVQRTIKLGGFQGSVASATVDTQSPLLPFKCLKCKP